MNPTSSKIREKLARIRRHHDKKNVYNMKHPEKPHYYKKKGNMYKLLKEGDLWQEGDEMQSPITGEWKPIPEQWLGKGWCFSHKDNNTFSRCKMQARRKIEHNTDTSERESHLTEE